MSVRGFTLVEVLVVFFIIGIIVSTATLVLPGDRMEEITNEARRLQAVLKIAQDEAISKGQEYGFRLQGSGYQFQRYESDSNEWVDASLTSLRNYALPQGIIVNGTVEDTKLLVETLKASQPDRRALAKDKNPLANAPGLLFFSTGEHMAFELLIGEQNRPFAFRLQSDGFSGIELSKIGVDERADGLPSKGRQQLEADFQ